MADNDFEFTDGYKDNYNKVINQILFNNVVDEIKARVKSDEPESDCELDYSDSDSDSESGDHWCNHLSTESRYLISINNIPLFVMDNETRAKRFIIERARYDAIFCGNLNSNVYLIQDISGNNIKIMGKSKGLFSLFDRIIQEFSITEIASLD